MISEKIIKNLEREGIFDIVNEAKTIIMADDNKDHQHINSVIYRKLMVIDDIRTDPKYTVKLLLNEAIELHAFTELCERGLCANCADEIMCIYIRVWINLMNYVRFED